MSVPNLPPSYGTITSMSDLLAAMNLYKSELQKGVTDVAGKSKFVSERVAKIRELKDFSKEANQYIEIAKQKNVLLQRITNVLFGKIGGKFGAGLDSAANVGGILGFVSAIALTFDIKKQEEIQELNLKATSEEQASTSRGFTLFINKQLANNARFARLESNLAKEKILRDKTAADAAYVLRETPKIRELAQAANKKANDSLYETRTNTARFKTQIAGIEKFNNDITYEIREGRKQLQETIDGDRKETQKAINFIQADTQKNFDVLAGDINKTIISINKNAEINNQNTSTVDKKLDRFTGVDFPKYVESKIGSSLLPVNSVVAGIKLDVKKALDLGAKADFKSDTNQKEIKEIQIKLTTGLPEVKVIQRDIADNIKPAIFREGETRKIWEAKQSEELKTTIGSYFGQQDKILKDLQVKFEVIVGDNRRLLDRTSKVEFTTTTETPTKLQQLRTDVDKLKTDVDKTKEMDKEANRKLDEIKPLLAGLPAIAIGLAAIPRNVANEVASKLPNIADITNAAATGTCKTYQPGGCGAKALDSLADKIDDAANTRGRGLLDAINTGSNAAQLTLLNTINGKLGDIPLVGGVSGAIKKIFDNKLADRVIAYFTLVTSLHNALMLSNNIAATLFSAIDNIGGLFGFDFENEKGEKVGIQQQLSQFYTGLLGQLFGTGNVTAFTETFAKANRVYQATTNMFSQVRSMFDAMRNINEMTAEHTGKIGNALKKAGVVFENAYNFMPEKISSMTAQQSKFQNIFDGLETIQTATSNIDQITSEVRNVGDTFNEFKNVKDTFVAEFTDKSKVIDDAAVESKNKAKLNSEVPETAVGRAD